MKIRESITGIVFIGSLIAFTGGSLLAFLYLKTVAIGGIEIDIMEFLMSRGFWLLALADTVRVFFIFLFSSLIALGIRSLGISKQQPQLRRIK